MAKTLHVYSRPSCVQCTAVKRYLDSKGVTYGTSESDDATRAFLFDLNKYQSAPVTVVFDDDQPIFHFYGNDRGKLDEAIALLAA
jgi:glutaredoxin